MLLQVYGLVCNNLPSKTNVFVPYKERKRSNSTMEMAANGRSKMFFIFFLSFSLELSSFRELILSPPYNCHLSVKNKDKVIRGNHVGIGYDRFFSFKPPVQSSDPS